MIPQADTLLSNNNPVLGILFHSYSLEGAHARVVLVEAQNRLLAPFHDKLRQNALQTLHKQGVEVLLNEYVTRATADAVYLKK